MKHATLLCAASLLALSTATFATTTITFPDGGPLDQALYGAQLPVTDAPFHFNLTVVDMFDTDGGWAIAGATHKSSTHATNGLGVNSAGTQLGSTTIDDGEIIRISFDQDITLDSIVMAAFTTGEAGTISIGAGAPVALETDGVTQAIGVSVPAGTLIDIAAATGTTMGVWELTVTAVGDPGQIVDVTVEKSTDLVNWVPATLGVHDISGGPLYFRAAVTPQ